MTRLLRNVAFLLAASTFLPLAADAAQLKGWVTYVEIVAEDGTVIDHDTVVVNGDKLITVTATDLKERQIRNLEGTYVVLQGDYVDELEFDLDETKPIVMKGKFRRSEVGGPVDKIKLESGERIGANFRKHLEPKAFHRPLWLVGMFRGNTNTFIVRSWSNASWGNNVTREEPTARGVTTTVTNGQVGQAQGAGMLRY